MNKITIVLSITLVLLIGIGAYVLSHSSPTEQFVATNSSESPTTADNTSSSTQVVGADSLGQDANKEVAIIGKSAEGKDISAYHYGTGNKELLFVGGIHGGYEWNTVLIAYNLIDYLKQNPGAIPANIKVTVIPVLNPDGLNKVVGTTGRFTASDVSPSLDIQVAGRFNGNNVDINRNFDCDWQASGMWQKTKVSGGNSVFSEPESLAIKQYVDSHTLTAVVMYNSAAGGVYSSNCHNGVSTETASLTQLYAKAVGYPAYENFDFYALTGDMTNWLAKKNIPAISVLLTNHTDTEWDKNQAGVTALLQHYAE